MDRRFDVKFDHLVIAELDRCLIGYNKTIKTG